ncbi:collagen alpha-3(VI) chain-like [Thalassophryne amazonica]|uniref:collagen alpha-3(VI) chain-like n=2 Tax=Thalassophryne amazonica TaxID=390379 RepID=UPI0014710FB5|nr:collagen alpha-3(VI) chain-like [Thalassophryne amazonica]
MRRRRMLPIFALLGLLFVGLFAELDAQDDCAQGLAADIYFLVDSSWSMGKENFEHVRQFLYSTVEALHDAGGDRFKFALVQYSGSPETEFHLNSYPSIQGVLAHIKAMSYRGGGTRTGLGLDFLIRTHLNTASGSRAGDGATQVVVVLTDGRSQDDVSEPAQVLRLAAVVVFAVGVQDAVDWELREMASQPHNAHVLSVDSFLNLREIIHDLVVGLCGAVTQLGSAPVETEVPLAGEGAAQDTADLIILIDGSQNVGAANVPYVRDLALKIIEPLDVGRDTIRVALVLYSTDPDIKFYLNSYDTKADILDAVKGLTFTGGDESNLGAALEEVASSLLGQTAGGRAEEGVPQVLVVISAGPSTDDIGFGDRALKRAGVLTFSMAIGDTAAADLEVVATDTSFFLSATDFRSLGSMSVQILPYIIGVAQRTIIVQTEFKEALAIGKRDIIFLIDSTMGATLIGSVREFIKRFVDNMPIAPDQVQVGIATFSDTARIEMDLNTHGSRESLTAALGRIKPKQAQTINIGAALDFVRLNMVRPEKGSRLQQGVPQIVVLMTSRRSSDSVNEPARALQQMGVLTIAIGSKAAVKEELTQIAFPQNFVYELRDFRMLLRQPAEIIDALSTLAGVVVTEVPTETVEITTVQTQKVLRDIVFLVDGSDYVGSGNLPYVREFITNVINQLDVRPDRVQIGLMQFAEQPKTEFYLNSYRTRQEVLDRISQLWLTGGSVLNTGAAMNYALSHMFQPSTGSRRKQGVQQVLVLVTGGPSADPVKIIADKLAVAGVLTFTVSSGQADDALLRTVAFVPELAYHERSFSNIPYISDQIFHPLITVVGDTDVGTLPEEPAITGPQRDVAFLIDGSDNVRADFPYIKDFIIKVIQPLDVGTDKVQISVVQHSERPTPSFYLNSYQKKDDVIRAVNGMTVAGGRGLNTGSALKFMKDTILSESHGSRAAQNVPQFLIVLTGGRSRDNVKEPAGALKTKGVVPFGVGVKDADPRQIEAISHNPSFAFKVREFSDLGTIPQKLNSYVSLPKDQLQVILDQVHGDAVKRDVVFLLDGSDNTQSGFPEIQLFVKSIVEGLSVGEGKDRVSVVQYADNPEASFYLSSHRTKEDVMNAIDSLRHKGGRRLNTGAALQFVRHNVFTSSTGSRRLEGVPQILILLSTQESSDNVKSPAIALKDREIVTLVIGVGDETVPEMEMIAFEPGFIYKVTELSKLLSIQPQLVTFLNIFKGTEESITKVSDLLVELETVHRDIVFLLDGSDNTKSGFSAMQRFIQSVVETLSVGENKDRVSVVQYSNDAQMDFSLKTYMEKQEVLDAVQQLTHKGGTPLNIGAALDYVRNYAFTDSSGSRREEDSKKIDLVFLIDGSHDSRNGFEVQPDIVKKDIVFLLDGSDGTRNGFPAMQDLVERVVEKLSVGENNDRVSVVQYSRDTEVHFYLNTYKTREDVVDSVRGLQHRGGSPLNTGAALQYVGDNVFTNTSGSRRLQGVPQLLILLSGGRSFDNVDTPASALKQQGIFAVGIGTRTSDRRELQKISYDPTYALLVSEFNDLPDVQEQLFSVLSTMPARVTPMPPTVIGKEFLFYFTYSSDNVDIAKFSLCQAVSLR